MTFNGTPPSGRLQRVAAVATTIRTWTAGFFNFLRTVVVDSLVVGALVLAVVVAFREIARPDTVIEEIALPKTLSDLGYSGQVAAMRLVDAVNKLNDEALRLSDLDEQTSLIPSSRQFELVETQTGLSLRTVSALVDSLFPGRRTRVAGEFVCLRKACEVEDMQLRLRVFDGSTLKVTTAGPIGAVGAIGEKATEDRIEDYFRRSSVELLKAIDPIVITERLAASATADPYNPEFGDQRPVREEAIRLSKALVRRGHEDDARAAALLGQIYSVIGEKVEAERWFARVKAIASPEEAPLIATADYHWGQMLAGKPEAQEKWQAASAIFEASANRGRLHSSYLIWQGLTLEALQRFDDAEVAYRRWVAAEPDDSGARYQLAYLLAQRAKADNSREGMQEAIQEFEGVLDIDPTHYRAYNEIAVLLRMLGEPVASLRYYLAANTLAPKDKIIGENLRGAAGIALASDRPGTCDLVRPGKEARSAEDEKLAILLRGSCGL